MNIMSVNTIALTLFGYDMSWLELLGTISGFITVIYAARANILTWPTGLINNVFFFALFYQVQLYSDMMLQVYFFAVSVYGWTFWGKRVPPPITSIQSKSFITLIVVTGVIGLLVGTLMSQVHVLFPSTFAKPAAYPFPDAMVMVYSMVAVVLLSMKKIQAWYLWIFVDCVSIVLFALKGIYLVSFEYMVFLGIAISGLITWRKS